MLLSYNIPSAALSVAVVPAASDESQGDGRGTNNGRPVLLAFTKDGKVHRWHLPAWASTGADGSVGEGRGADGVAGPGGCLLTTGSHVRGAVALPVGATLSAPVSDAGVNAGRGRQLIVFAADRGLVAMDAARGVLVQEIGAGEEGGGGPVSHVAVTPDGKTIVSVGDVSRTEHGSVMVPFFYS